MAREVDLEKIRAFQLRDDDMFLITYAKSGTTWFKEILTLLLCGGDVEAPNFKGIPPDVRSPYLEFVLSAERYPKYKAINEGQMVPPDFDMDKMESPRLLTTHLNLSELPKQFDTKKHKIVYVARNPKDMMVSLYNFLNVLPFLPSYETFDKFCEAYCEGKRRDGLPGTELQGWHEHVLTWWERRHEDNVMFVTFEDAKEDLSGVVQKLADFLGLKLDKEAIQRVADHCCIDSMKKNPLAQKSNFMGKFGIDQKHSPFVRKGKVGGWKDTFTVAMNEYFDQCYEDLKKDTDLEFTFDL